MVLVSYFKCDICGGTATATGDWFCGVASPSEIRIMPFAIHATYHRNHLCGQECAARYLANWFATGRGKGGQNGNS